jgi:hypothetical protein
MKAHTEYLSVHRAVVLACALAACGPSTSVSRATSPPVTTEQKARAEAAELEAVESQTLVALAGTDPRLAARLRVEADEADLRRAAVRAFATNDESAAFLGGAPDVFSFDARARRLDEEHARVARLHPTRPSLERELLLRFLDEESARVDEERQLPRSASELTRGIVATWTAPRGLEEMHKRDTWLTRRLDEVRASLESGPMRQVEIAELEDALDPLERLADPASFADAHAAIARLRIALSGMRRTHPPGDGGAGLKKAMLAHLGVAPDPEALRARMVKLEAALRADATAQLSSVSETDAKAARDRAETLMLASGTCGGSGARSRVLAFGPPPERAPICGALRFLAKPAQDVDALGALLALHDDVALALLALDVQIGDRDPEAAAGAHRPLSSIPPEREARWIRLAATRPLVPLGAAMMAELVLGHPERAERWLAFGDASIDIVVRELGF